MLLWGACLTWGHCTGVMPVARLQQTCPELVLLGGVVPQLMLVWRISKPSTGQLWEYEKWLGPAIVCINYLLHVRLPFFKMQSSHVHLLPSQVPLSSETSYERKVKWPCAYPISHTHLWSLRNGIHKHVPCVCALGALSVHGGCTSLRALQLIINLALHLFQCQRPGARGGKSFSL